jgi:hypothetical protein
MLHHRCPKAAQYLWDWFLELCRGRPSGGVGLSPIPSVEIASWADLARLRPTSWELAVLRKLDSALLKSGSEENG